MTISREKIQQWLPHIIGLFFIIVLPIFVFSDSDVRAQLWLNRYYYQLTYLIIAFYINYLVIVPRYFFRPKKIKFFIILSIFVIILLILSNILAPYFNFSTLKFREIENSSKLIFGVHPRLFNDFLFLLVVIGFSTGMAVMQQFQKEKNEQKKKEKAHLATELAFLRNQISPHFFFNSLNNIYALIAIDGDKAQKAVEKLSGLMRYLIYESDTKMLALQKEITFTQNFIDLMRYRITTKVKINVNIQHDVPDIEIPPLIFIPFIENAFKHGISYREDSFIVIWLKIIGGNIVFECKNSIPKDSNKSTLEKGGLGIINIKRRLDLLYGKSAQLIQTNKDDTYGIKLIIPLNL